MSELDEKLKDIVFTARQELLDETSGTLITEYVKQTKQAFIDDGWIEPHKPDAYLAKEGLTIKVLEQHMDAINKEMALDWNKRNGYLSGQEWYDRFSTALVGYACLPVDAGSVDWDSGDVMRAAKKAAGIE